ncbi:MAG: hypothetical protein IJ570_09040 [Prevotella sp.]|nr:hypothetical protein [Prevotella sp.]
MTLHIFNPEHDIALASGLSNFTAPHAGRQLRHDLGFLPALWASEGDVVLVDDQEWAQRKWQRVVSRVRRQLQLELPQATSISLRASAGKNLGQIFQNLGLPQKNLGPTEKNLGPTEKNLGLAGWTIEPWGWNSALRAWLQRLGASKESLPTEEALQTIRELSHRRTAAALLPLLRVEGTVGEAFECHTAEEVEALLARYQKVIMKAPWSSSGRGLRFLSTDRTPLSQQAGWLRNMLQAQGCVMVEPYYNKVKDFGMEFMSDGHGHVYFLGLSLFHTENGAYTGNILATEQAKLEMLTKYITETLLREVQERICEELGRTFDGKYQGPFGVDMMVVRKEPPLLPSPLDGSGTDTKAFLLHPCVEINLRRTMGHVALSLTPTDDDIRRVMRIEYANNNYELKITKL